MSQSQAVAAGRSIDDVAELLADERRRTCLRILVERDRPVEVPDLATTVAARARGESLIEVPEDAHRRVHTGLVHAHLPMLVESGLVEWNRECRMAAATDHPALTDDAVTHLLETDADDWDAVLSALSDARRRRALAVLADLGTADRDAVVRRVLAAERDVDRDAVPDRAVADAAVEFHHVHLPLLQRAGLATYDGEAAEYVGHPDLDVDRLPLADDGVEHWDDGDAESTPDDVATIRGREAVIDRGQSLIDRADDELFLMITTDGLLEEECVEKLRAAADRGVDLYVGSQTTAVRDLVREEIPQATIWEPQLDWLNFPPRRETLGRLVIADREAVMLGTLGEEGPEGVHSETAITGDGETNSLVLLLTELLGGRLDHLDAQSEDFRSQLPF